jgi:hypothetical protein
MRELLTQYGTLNASVKALLDDPKSAILEIDRQVIATQRGLSAEATAKRESEVKLVIPRLVVHVWQNHD